MGLDMNIYGERVQSWIYNQEKEMLHGFPLYKRVETVDLAYWRKHPNLHGHIVRRFADGVDECQKIPLNEEQIMMIIASVRAGKLLKTTGFLFGESDLSPEQRKRDVEALERALNWLALNDDEYRFRVYYQASW